MAKLIFIMDRVRYKGATESPLCINGVKMKETENV